MSQPQKYRRAGFLNGLRIVSTDLAAHYRKLFDAIEEVQGQESLRMPEESAIRQAIASSQPPPDSADNVAKRVSLFDPHLTVAFIWEIATNSLLLDTVRSLLGRRIMLLCSGISCKYGRSSPSVQWHRDASYLGITPPSFISAWYALDRSDLSSGCLEVLPGSHIGTSFSTSRSEVGTSEPLELKPGEVSLHHPLLLHRSGLNQTRSRRCGIVFRYARADVILTQSSTGRTLRPIGL
ncbi:MAG TPA: phytanoyl-CoA dioxygenase family protein [Thermoanaerobaculia bacterium]|nr:phytanoyl-CoA dioxygenase family protein [Thermoanaerobaculia bacterium]